MRPGRFHEDVVQRLRSNETRFRASGSCIRTEDWLKIKCAMTDKFVIVGYVPGGHGGGLGAIRLGRKKGGQLVYAGKTGTGFNAKNSSTLMKQLKALEVLKPPLKMPKKKRDTKWVEPKLMAKIEYRDITDDGYVRHSSFKGLADEP